jgi:hypothetical protein
VINKFVSPRHVSLPEGPQTYLSAFTIFIIASEFSTVLLIRITGGILVPIYSPSIPNRVLVPL